MIQVGKGVLPAARAMDNQSSLPVDKGAKMG